ncbi:ornithine decarboxylase-like [Haemaphysalis longicornis]
MVIRPTEGLDFRKYQAATISDSILNAAQLSWKQASIKIRIDYDQNIATVSTPHEFAARKLDSITQLNINGKCFKINHYGLFTQDSSKGVLHDIPIEYTPQEILEDLWMPGYEFAACRQLGQSGSVVITILGQRVPFYVYYKGVETRCYLYKKTLPYCFKCFKQGHRSDVCPTPDVIACERCGARDPLPDHLCNPKCELCQGEHLTASKECRMRFREPYLLRKKKWEREHPSTPTESAHRSRSATRGNSGPAGSSKSRSTVPPQGNRSRSRSKSRQHGERQGRQDNDTDGNKMEAERPDDALKTFIFTHGTLEDAAREISGKQVSDDAFFVCDVRDIIRKNEIWRQCLPRVTPFYAVKSCPDPVVLAILKSLGVNFDCSNKNEIRALLNMGVEPSRIIYAHTVKSTSHMRFAENHGVELVTFDAIEELYKMKGKDFKLLLRIMSDEEEESISFNRKFGCLLSEARQILETARDLGCNVVGVSFHVGEAYKSPEIYTRSIERAKAVFDIAVEVGKPMTVLDIGGGFPGGVRSMEIYHKVCDCVRRATDLYFPASSGVQIIAEPGQFYVSSAYVLAVRVMGKRSRQVLVDGVPHPHQDVFLNETNQNCICRQLYHCLDIQVWPLEEPLERPRDVLTSLWGGTCNPLDSIEVEKLFFNVRVDEWLLMDNAGAYSLSFACGFNGMGFPPVHYIAPTSAISTIREVIESSPLHSGYIQPREVLRKNSVGYKHDRV